MPDIETCNAKATIEIGRFTSADVECGLEANHDLEKTTHVASETTHAQVGKERRDAKILFTWR